MRALLLNKNSRKNVYACFTDIMGLQYLRLPYMTKCMPFIKRGIFVTCENGLTEEKHDRFFSVCVIAEVERWTYDYIYAISLLYVICQYMVKPGVECYELWVLLTDLARPLVITSPYSLYAFLLEAFYWAGVMPLTPFFKDNFYDNSSRKRWYDESGSPYLEKDIVHNLSLCVIHADVALSVQSLCFSLIQKFVIYDMKYEKKLPEIII